MVLKVGEKIRSLRKSMDVTQERLADYLGVTCQAVSRWESGGSYPDIEILPSIANFFEVTTDNLLGVETAKTAERISEWERRWEALWEEGLWQEQEETLREALREFPNSHKLLCRLMQVLPYSHQEDEQKKSTNLKEAMKIGERILEDCLDDQIHYNIISNLAHIYMLANMKDKAIETAKRLPSISFCSEVVLANLAEGELRTKFTRETIELLADSLGLEIRKLTNESENDTEALNALNKVISLFSIIYDKGDFGFYHCRLAEAYRLMSLYYLAKSNNEEAINSLEKAVEHSIQFDSLEDGYKHSSWLVSNLVYDADTYQTPKNHNECWRLLNRYLPMERYDTFHGTNKFTLLEARLREYAK